MRPFSLNRPALAVAAAIVLAGCDAAADGRRGAEEIISETRPLDRQGTLRVENTNGKVVVETWDEPRVMVEAIKSFGFGASVDVVVRGEGDRVTVETRKSGGWLFGRGGKVEYRIKAPAEAHLDLRTVNGAVRVRGSAGTVRAATTNGLVAVEDAAGSVEASTTNGGVRVHFRRAPADGLHRLTTVNGGVTLVLPPDASGDFDGRTVNGGVGTEFPLEISGRLGGRRLSGRVGEGRARFELRAVNGGLRVERGSSP